MKKAQERSALAAAYFAVWRSAELDNLLENAEENLGEVASALTTAAQQSLVFSHAVSLVNRPFETFRRASTPAS